MPYASSAIHDFFNKIAHSYDCTNNLISLGLHHYWNRRLTLSFSQKEHSQFLDICAGTGAISKRYAKANPTYSKVTLVDFCPAMLEIAKQNLQSSARIQFIVADACSLPLPDKTFDHAAMAYGIRNIPTPRLAIQECYRVLKDGAVFSILELTRPKNRLLRAFHHVWLKYAVPLIGRLMSKDPSAYHYLKTSIEQFQEPAQIIELLQSCGFTNIAHKSLNGQIASLFIATKAQLLTPNLSTHSNSATGVL